MNSRTGIILMVFAMLCFSVSDGFIKASDGRMTSGQMIFYVGIGGAIFFAAASLIKGEPAFTKGFFHPAVLFRNLGEVVGVAGIFTAILTGTLSKTIAIHQLQPVAVTLGAVLFLGERVGWRRWGAIVFAFACVMLIIRPSLSGMDYTALLAFVGMIGLTVRDLATKGVPDAISSLQLSTYAYLALIPLGLVLTLASGESFVIHVENWPLMVGVLAFSMLAYIAITRSVRVAEISVVAPFRYSRMIFIFLIGIFIFGEQPDWQTYVGGIGIILAGLFMMLRDRSA